MGIILHEITVQEPKVSINAIHGYTLYEIKTFCKKENYM